MYMGSAGIEPPCRKLENLVGCRMGLRMKHLFFW